MVCEDSRVTLRILNQYREENGPHATIGSHFGQGTDKLGRRIAIALETLLIDDLPYGVPKGGLETLALWYELARFGSPELWDPSVSGVGA
ncbi:hypothetical protein Trco_001128 [Trichoderma cornu-damae]|uniref:Uncharacterized protein n=1 Tax=Trichoderma cornu-damae TaxID=654480 RepID=A0A9P8TZX5_9HYPO|nr:hypothetical protein Trco_001128 [Trichoderma cornu-damae]